MKRFITGIIIAALVLGLAACRPEPLPEYDESVVTGTTGDAQTKEEGPAGEPAEEAKVPMTEAALKLGLEEWPVIDGALACLPYYEKMASLVLSMPIEEARQYVLDNNTPASFDEIAEGEADLIFCLHGSEEQEAYAKACGVTLDYTPYALDAFVFFVNKDNPVESVTMQQLKDIYAGKITNWKALGGNDEPIIAYQRNEGSGSQTGLYQYVISPDEVMTPPTEQRIGDMGGIIDAVAFYDNAKGALGYSYLYFVTNQHFDEDIKLLKVDGFAPDATNIQSGKYPMVTEYCLVTTTDKKTEGSSVKRIIDWCTSDEGQRLAEELSYVPVGVK